MKILNVIFKVSAVAVIVASTFVAQASRVNGLIVGGDKVQPGAYPFMVSMHSSSYRGHFCGGSLIAPSWVLTAAHCVSGGAPSKIYLGLQSQDRLGEGVSYSVKKVYSHPKYAKMDYDFALIELASPVANYAPIALNAEEIPISDIESEWTQSTTMGWGTLKEGSGKISVDLMEVSVPLRSQAQCLKGYPGKISDRMICAGLDGGGKDSCQGDSGGPLIVKDNVLNRYVLAGVVSWGEGCARANRFGVYSKVNSVIDWIRSTAGIPKEEPPVAPAPPPTEPPPPPADPVPVEPVPPVPVEPAPPTTSL